MHALPAAPAPPPRRQVLMGTALASVGTIMVFGAMLAIWLLQRERTIDAGEPWLPQGVTIPEVPTNVMLMSFLGVCTFAQWAVWAVKRGDRVHAGLALGLTAVLALAIINAQAYVYSQIELPIAGSGYAGMFYAITGAIVVLLIVGLVFTAVTAFRVLGGRSSDGEIVAAHAMYWYVIAAVFSAVWLVVYVTK